MVEKMLFSDGGEADFIINEGEDTMKILAYESLIIIENIAPSSVSFDRLEKKLEAFAEKEDTEIDYLDIYHFESFFEELGYKVEVSHSEMYEDVRETLVFDMISKEFANLAECYAVNVYEYFDGSNKKIVEIDSVTYLEVSESAVDLDEWDGNNFTTGGVGLHESVQKIKKMDGRNVEDYFLLVKESQWQGSHDTGEILSKDELEFYLHSINRNVDEYMKEIETLV